MLPEPMEIKRGLSLWVRKSLLALGLCLWPWLSGVFLTDAWMNQLQHFPMDEGGSGQPNPKYCLVTAMASLERP